MVFSVKTYNNINQIGLKELGNHFQIDGDLAENPDAYIIRSQNLHDTVFSGKCQSLFAAKALRQDFLRKLPPPSDPV